MWYSITLTINLIITLIRAHSITRTIPLTIKTTIRDITISSLSLCVTGLGHFK